MSALYKTDRGEIKLMKIKTAEGVRYITPAPSKSGMTVKLNFTVKNPKREELPYYFYLNPIREWEIEYKLGENNSPTTFFLAGAGKLQLEKSGCFAIVEAVWEETIRSSQVEVYSFKVKPGRYDLYFIPSEFWNKVEVNVGTINRPEWKKINEIVKKQNQNPYTYLPII